MVTKYPNKETVTGYLHDPGQLGSGTLPELEELVKAFPYFQTARILLTMNLSQQDPNRFESELKTTAIHVADRRVLKKHLDDLSKNAGKVTERPVPESSLSATDPVEQQQAGPEPEKTEARTEEAAGETREPERVEVEEQAVQEEASRQKVQEEPPTTTADVQFAEDTATPSESGDAGEIDTEESIAEAREEAPDEEEDRLLKLKHIVEARLKSIAAERMLADKQTDNEPPTPEAVEPEAVDPDRSEQELIDEFIRNEPTISRTHSAFFNPVNAAKESIVDEEDIVSETLARIYFDQGKYAKAISIYQKLSLNNPEKSSYFARLIEKAKAELKN